MGILFYFILFIFIFLFFILYFIYFILFIFREGKGSGGEREMPLECPPTGDLACNPGIYALTGNQTGDPLVCRPVLIPVSHTSQGLSGFETANGNFPPITVK